jgi:hypothetical protein
MKQLRLQRVVVSTNNLPGKSRKAAWDDFVLLATFFAADFFTRNSPGTVPGIFVVEPFAGPFASYLNSVLYSNSS